MSNRIDNYTATAAGSVRGSVKTADANSKASSSDAPVSNVARIDSAKFTPDAMKLQQMDSDIAKTPVSDNQRVAALRKAIANGSYAVNTKAVASKLARMEWDISGT